MSEGDERGQRAEDANRIGLDVSWETSPAFGAPPARVLCVAGARPNFVKVAPLLRAFRARMRGGRALFEARLVHTGQHSAPALSDGLFEELRLPPPDVHLGVRAGTPAEQSAEIRRRLVPVLASFQPHLVVVVGDVTSTLAAAQAAAKATSHAPFATRLGRRNKPLLAHVEAGLRCFDEDMPEERNRRLTDALADLLYVSEPSGLANLRREGIADERCVLVGNVMIDSLVALQAEEAGRPAPCPFGLAGDYGVVTLHRPANVDDPRVLGELLQILDGLAAKLPLVFPVHPRTRARLGDVGCDLRPPRWHLLEPLGYGRFIRLVASARVVLTDSGGIQEETTFLGVPCLTLRPSTERPLTVDLGTNRIVSRSSAAIATGLARALAGEVRGTIPPQWDGHAARRIVDHVETVLAPLWADEPSPGG